MNRLNPAMLQALLAAQQPMQMPAQNLLASAQDGFDPNGPVAQMLRAQAAQAARQGPQKPPAKPAQRPGAIVPNQQEVLRQRMRDAGL